jgi:poly-gamma-glutamate capsule biosynthesis protein CapA/YwtB (metallophosphatase superfamily)
MLNVSFLGDISLNDNYISYYKDNLNPFRDLEPILKNSDYVVGNLECMVKGEQSENELKKPRLSTTLDTLNYLKSIHLGIACLAQNHIYDHLEDGFNKTTGFLRENDIKFIGASLERQKVDIPIILEKDGTKIGMLNYITKDTNPNLPENSKVFINIFQTEKVIDDIQKLKPKVNHVVLILHWGGRVEGGLYPDWYQPKLGHRLIDAGADLIIGHHSHTIQPYEVYKDKYIFYSLGNFCFSDYWFKGDFNPISKRWRVSAIVGINFMKDKYEVQSDYFLNDLVKFSKFDNYKNIVHKRNRFFKIFLSIKIVWYFYYLHKQFILPLVLFFSRSDLSFKDKLFRLSRYINKKLTNSL